VTPLRWRRRWAIAALLMLGLLILALLLRQTVLNSGDRTWARIKQTGVWRVGMDPSFPPFENLDGVTGLPAGFDVDLARAIAARWGVRAEFVGVGFDQLMDAVVANRVDSAISALTVAPHRTEEMRFSEPYIEAGMVLAVPETSRLTSALEAAGGRNGEAVTAEMAQALAGQRVAAEWGSEGDALTRRLQTQANGDLRLVLRSSTDDALRAVLAGEADAAIVDAISLALFSGGGGSLVAIGQPLRSDPYAIVVPKHASELLRQVNEALATLRDDGTLAEIRARWLRPQER
jgi:ABC-type amino acid transport substrate-binding protein